MALDREPMRFIPDLLQQVQPGMIGRVGTIFGAIAANTRMREVMLPVLQFPVSVPIFIGAVEATTGAMRGLAPVEFQQGIRLLLAFDAVFLILSYLLFEYVMEG